MTDREKFEVWVKENNSEWVRGVICALSAEGNYLSSKVQSAWEGWQAAIASQNEPGDGWFAWGGGQCPVPKGTLVDILDGDGTLWEGVVACPVDGAYSDAAEMFWEHRCLEMNAIVAYRVVKS